MKITTSKAIWKLNRAYFYTSKDEDHYSVGKILLNIYDKNINRSLIKMRFKP